MMPTKIGSYGSTAGYGASATMVSSASLAAQRQLVTTGTYQPPSGTKPIVRGATKAKPAPYTPTLVVTKANTYVPKNTTSTGGSASSSFDPRSALATGYSFLTDDQMYNGVGGKTNTGMTDATAIGGPVARPLWQYLLGAVVVGGGGYFLYKKFSGKRVSA